MLNVGGGSSDILTGLAQITMFAVKQAFSVTVAGAVIVLGAV